MKILWQKFYFLFYDKILWQKYPYLLNDDFILTDILEYYFADYFISGKLGHTGIVVNL